VSNEIDEFVLEHRTVLTHFYIMPVLLVREAPRDRLEVCSGARETNEPAFRSGSLVPKGDWRQVTKDEDQIVWDHYNCSRPLLENIAVIRVLDVVLPSGREYQGSTNIEPDPANSIELLKSLQDDPRSSLLLNWESKWFSSSEVKNEVQRKFAEVCSGLVRGVPLENKGCWLSKGEGKSLSTTIDRSDGLRIGLHIDRWERMPLGTVASARNRACLNLGPGSRYLVFAATDLREIAKRYNFTSQTFFTTRHAQTYLRDHPKVPVFRLRIDPGEAYIAPTECLIHDGQASNSTGQWACTMFGRFENAEQAMRLSVV
jgi:hypothetical protein